MKRKGFQQQKTVLSIFNKKRIYGRSSFVISEKSSLDLFWSVYCMFKKSDPFFSYHTKWAKTSWTYSLLYKRFDLSFILGPYIFIIWIRIHHIACEYFTTYFLAILHTILLRQSKSRFCGGAWFSSLLLYRSVSRGRGALSTLLLIMKRISSLSILWIFTALIL